MGTQPTRQPALEWVERRKAQRDKSAMLKIKTEGQDFWKRLVVELGRNTGQLPSLGVRGSTNSFENAHTREWSCRVEAFKSEGVPAMTYTDLFYRPGDSKIRSLTLEGESLTYSFWISPEGEVVVVPGDGYAPKAAGEVAATLVEAMVDRMVSYGGSV